MWSAGEDEEGLKQKMGSPTKNSLKKTKKARKRKKRSKRRGEEAERSGGWGSGYHMGHGHERDRRWSSWERYGKKEREGTRKEKDKKIKK